VVRFIDVESCGLRFKSEGELRPVSRIRFEGAEHTVTGLSSAGPCPAQQIVVEDSSAGTAVLIIGGDLGVRLEPGTLDEPYLLLSADSIIE
jgi:hypothetical protein